MQQEPMFFECMEDAARHVVAVLGGAKTVGTQMRPSKSPDQAARWLLDCLNGERHEHLQLSDLIWLAREGRKANCHALMHYLADSAGYAPPLPVEPADEKAALMREFIATGKLIRHILHRLDGLGGVEGIEAQIRAVK